MVALALVVVAMANEGVSSYNPPSDGAYDPELDDLLS